MKFMLGGSYIYEKGPEPDFIQIAHHHHFKSFPKKDPVNFDLRFQKGFVWVY
jgi:hypothetical protein